MLLTALYLWHLLPLVKKGKRLPNIVPNISTKDSLSPITLISSISLAWCASPSFSAVAKHPTMSVEVLTTVSPTTNKPVVTRNGLTDADIALLPEDATEAFENYRRTSLSERQAIVKKALQLMDEKQDELAKELTEQMGRPIAYTPKEITTAVKRADYLLRISGEALRDTDGESEKGFKRFIRKVPVGPVLIIFAWNVSS